MYIIRRRYKSFPSTSFKGTSLVVPDDAYHFFGDLFDLGKQQTNGRFNTYEVDFMADNFRGCTDCFSDVGAADRFYVGMRLQQRSEISPSSIVCLRPLICWSRCHSPQ